jgi:hypothetical protein
VRRDDPRAHLWDELAAKGIMSTELTKKRLDENLTGQRKKLQNRFTSLLPLDHLNIYKTGP